MILYFKSFSFKGLDIKTRACIALTLAVLLGVSLIGCGQQGPLVVPAQAPSDASADIEPPQNLPEIPKS